MCISSSLSGTVFLSLSFSSALSLFLSCSPYQPSRQRHSCSNTSNEQLCSKQMLAARGRCAPTTYSDGKSYRSCYLPSSRFPYLRSVSVPYPSSKNEIAPMMLWRERHSSIFPNNKHTSTFSTSNINDNQREPKCNANVYIKTYIEHRWPDRNSSNSTL